MDRRSPSYSQEAEQSVLGGLMLDNSAFEKVSDLLTETSFFVRGHQLIYSAIQSLLLTGKPADSITVYAWLEDRGKHDESGGLPYIDSLVASVPSAANARRYAEVVRDRAIEREALAILERAHDTIVDRARDLRERIDDIQSELSGLQRSDRKTDPVHIGEPMKVAMDTINGAAERRSAGQTVRLGYTCGIKCLDDLAGGFRPGKLYVLGGRPGMGKTAVALNIAAHLSIVHRVPVLNLSQEMGKHEMTLRYLAAETGIELTRLESGDLEGNEWARLVDAIDRYRDAPLYIDDQAALTMLDIRRKARPVKGLALLVLDYLQLCSGGDKQTDRGSRNQELEVITRGLKQLAVEFNCAVLALSALNRSVETLRKFGRAVMSDFKDCGSIEADADVMMSLFKIRQIGDGSGDLIGADFIKNRSGSTGSCAMYFYKRVMQLGSTDYDVEDLLAEPKKAKVDEL